MCIVAWVPVEADPETECECKSCVWEVIPANTSRSRERLAFKPVSPVGDQSSILPGTLERQL